MRPSPPFEQYVLPKFACWLQDIIEREQAEVLMPVERKGAFLLESVQHWLQQERGVTFRQEVIYKRALPFVDAAAISGKRVLILDDATRSGRTLDRYRERVSRYGEPSVRLLACLGYYDAVSHAQLPLRGEIECFLEAQPSVYQQYLWQIAEMLISRGLPPGSAYHIFHLDSRTPSHILWPQLLEVLEKAGQLDVHGSMAVDGSVLGATLHWPSFFPSTLFSNDDLVHHEGVIKIRLFFNQISGVIYLIPMVFPAVEIPRILEDTATIREELLSRFRIWSERFSRVGDLLLQAMYPISDAAEVLYHAVTLTLDIELTNRMRNFLQENGVLDEAATVAPDSSLFAKLYGNKLFRNLDNGIRHELIHNPNSVVHPHSQIKATPRFATKALVTQQARTTVNTAVRQFTAEMVGFLKRSYLRANAGNPLAEWKTVGYSFSDLLQQEFVPDPNRNLLLLSRSLDFGCGTASLVPYLDTVSTADESRQRITRKYRTSEIVEDSETNPADEPSYRRQVAMETVGTAIHLLKRRSRRWRGRPVPSFIVYKTLAILIAAVPEFLHTSLCVNAREHGPEIAIEEASLINPPDRVAIRNITSEFFHTTGDGAMDVTQSFIRRYESGSLYLNRRQMVGPIESYLIALVQLLDSAENVTQLLTAWSVCATGRLGLEYVMQDVDLALKEIEKPLEILAGDRPIRIAKLQRSATKARHYIGVARSEKLESLKRDWTLPVRAEWNAPIQVERDLLGSLLYTREANIIYKCALAFCWGVEAFVSVVVRFCEELTESGQGVLFAAPETPTTLPEQRRLDSLHRLNGLTSLLRGSCLVEKLLVTDLEAVNRESSRAGRMLKRYLQLLRAFERAYSILYGGSRTIGIVKQSPEGSQRLVVLHADLSDSTSGLRKRLGAQGSSWINNGLNMVAQWGLAFGGTEPSNRKSRQGDGIWISFHNATNAVLCGAMILEHARVLTLAGVDDFAFQFRIGIHHDSLIEGDGDNHIGLAIHEAAILVKWQRAASVSNALWITRAAYNGCDEWLRFALHSLVSPLVPIGDELAEEGCYSVNCEAILGAYATRLEEGAKSVWSAMSGG